MKGMTNGRKAKVSVSLSADVVERIDRRAKSEHSTRSAVLESLLRDAERLSSERTLAAEVEAYYRGGDAEGDAISRASSRAARKLEVDKPRGRK